MKSQIIINLQRFSELWIAGFGCRRTIVAIIGSRTDQTLDEGNNAGRW